MFTFAFVERFSTYPALRMVRLCAVFALLISTLGMAVLPGTTHHAVAQVYEELLEEPLVVSPQAGPPGTAFTFSAKANMFELSTGFAGPVLHIWEPGEYNQADIQEPAIPANRITIRGREDTSYDLMTLNMTRTLPTYADAPCGEYTAAIRGGSYQLWSAPTTFTISCGGAAPTAEPVIETVPGDIEIDLGDGLVLRSERTTGAYNDPRYNLEMHIPMLTGDPVRAAAFNRLLADLLEQRLDEYRAGFLPETCAMNACSIEVEVEVTNSEGGILGLLFTMYVNFGGAHPNFYHMTLNYDLVANQPLTLSDLFQEANYLDTLYGSALNELLQLDYFDDPDRVNGYIEPIAENYVNWAITPNGLIIVFDTFPHVIAALQQVFIPAAELADIVDPDSPVAVLWGIVPTEPTPMPALSAEIPDGLVYSAGGQQYHVDLDTDSSTSIGAAPPANSILGPGDSRLWMEMLGDVGISGNSWEAFQIVQSRQDGSDRQVLLDSETFFEQFGQFLEGPFSDYSKYVTRQELVLSADSTQVFFSVCNPSQEAESCDFLQLDLSSSSVREMDEFFGPGWVHSDGQRAISSSKMACIGSLQMDGEVTRLSGTPVNVVWLPDKRFIFSRHICSGIWDPQDVEPQYDIILANADGSDDRVLVPGMIASDMALAPDQQTLAFISTEPRDAALWLVNLDGSDLRKVMDLPDDAADLRWYGDASASGGPDAEPAPAEELAPAPTDGEIAYVQDGNIYLLDLASGETTPLVEDGTVGLVGSYQNTQLAWSPDGQRLAFSSNSAGDYDIYVLDVASGEVEQISTDPLDEYLPTFSPDGILFFLRIIDPYEGGGPEAYGENDLMVQTNSIGAEVVHTLPCEPFSISARSDTEMSVAYGCNLSLGNIGTIDTQVPVPVEASPITPERSFPNRCSGMRGYSAEDGKWSHDGTTLAVIGADCPEGDSSGNWRNALFLVDPDNPDAEPERILGDQEWLTSLDWAPDDEWLVYAQQISFDEPDGLWLVSAEGGEPVQVSRDGHSPAWRPAVAVEDDGEEEQGNYTVTGRVTDTDGNPVADVTVMWTGELSTRTDEDGYYTIEGLAEGEYGLKPTREGYTSDPPVRTVIVTTDEENQDFVLVSQAYVTGTVRDRDGNPVSGVVLHAGHCGWDTTDEQGNYAIWGAGAIESQLCTMRPSQALPDDSGSYLFDPPAYIFYPVEQTQQDFVMHSERRPLVFIPGLMGSYLYEMTNPPSERWIGFASGDRDRLVLGTADLIATDAIREYTAQLVGGDVKKIDTYDTLLRHLQKREDQGGSGYTEVSIDSTDSTPLERCEQGKLGGNDTLFVFAYDWRKSNADNDEGNGNSDLLGDYIECVREQTGSEYVDVVAHSMGGILTRRYVLDNQNSHHIDRFISVATPWLGAPRAIAVIETGQYPDITDALGGTLTAIWAHELKPVAETSPGPHELLPSKTYFDQFSELHADQNSVFEEQGWDYNQQNGYEEGYGYTTLVDALDHRFASDPGTANHTFHTAEQDNLSEWYGVDHYNFYGDIDEDITPVRLRTLQTFMCEWSSIGFNAVSSDEVVCVNSVDHFRLTLSAGDGTVPVISAVPPPLEAPECNEEYQGGHVACFSGDKEHADHGALVRNDQVLAAIVDVLARRAPAPPVAAGSTMSDDAALAYSASFSALEQQADANTAQPAHYITILNTPSATLADALGNTTDAISGTLTTPVPNASYYILGEQAHMFVMPADAEYNLTLPVSEEPMYLELRTGTGDTSTQTIRYSDLTLPISTTAMLEISPQGVKDLHYDSDGDGTFDTEIEPTVAVNGNAANDTNPPAVSIAVEQQDGRWLATITAEDDESGVKQVLYSTDDQRYMVYEGSFAVNPNEISTVYAFADDNVANRSGVVVYEVDLHQNQLGRTLIVVSITMVLLFVLILPGLVFVLIYTQRQARNRPRSR